jgi:hypothetical protein
VRYKCNADSIGIIPEAFFVEEARHPYIDEASPYGWDFQNKKVTILGDGNQVNTIIERCLEFN